MKLCTKMATECATIESIVFENFQNINKQKAKQRTVIKCLETWQLIVARCQLWFLSSKLFCNVYRATVYTTWNPVAQVCETNCIFFDMIYYRRYFVNKYCVLWMGRETSRMRVQRQKKCQIKYEILIIKKAKRSTLKK